MAPAKAEAKIASPARAIAERSTARAREPRPLRGVVKGQGAYSASPLADIDKDLHCQLLID